MPRSPRSEGGSQRKRGVTASPASSAKNSQSSKTSGTPTRRSARGRGQENEEPPSSPSLRALPTSPGASERRAPPSEAPSDLSSRLHYSPQTHTEPQSPGSHLRTYSRLSQGTRGGGGGGGFARGRPDLDSHARHHRQVEVPADAAGAGNKATAQVYIWGTRICVEEVQATFRRFLRTYKEAHPDEDEALLQQVAGETELDPNLPYYMQRLAEIAVTEETFLDLNLQHLRAFDDANGEGNGNERSNLYRQMLTYPADLIPYLDMIVNDIFFTEFPDVQLRYNIEIRPFNAAKTRNMRALNPEDMDQLITMTGMVIRSSALIPEMVQGFFQCNICNERVEVEVDRGRVEEPTLCRNCQNNHCYQLIHNRSVFKDKQIVKLQESPDDMPAGQTPHTVSLYTYGKLVDSVQPGDRVTVTGIYRAVPVRLNPRMRTVKAVYRTYVDVLHFRRSHTDKLHQEEDGAGLTIQRLEEIKALAKKPDLYHRLAHALAPSIFEHEDVKKGILCLLMGGTKKDLSASGRTQARSELNILLCGDPGTSKSQLLQYVHNLVPRSQYTSGKGSSAVGLTAYVTRDPDTKHFVLQTGALVLADNGVCCIDEFDKMSDATRSVLHEVMEQQTLSIAKAGIICQLNARTSILAAANPVDSQWNKEKTIVENVQLSHTLLSRFDLIFLLVDPQDRDFDRRLATHLVSLYYQTEEDGDSHSLDMALIRDYIAFAKANVHPRLSEEAGALLVEKYLKMRKVGAGRGAVGAYPRQLESLIRLSEAHAKVYLRETVKEEDVEEAYRLHREAMKQSAMDPKTGRIDVNILSAGVSASSLKAAQDLASVIQAHLQKRPQAHFAVKRLLQELRDSSQTFISHSIFEEALGHLLKQDIIIRSNDRIRLRNTSQ